jgi:hypothetical protein
VRWERRKADAAESGAHSRSSEIQIAAVSIALCVFDPSYRCGLGPDMGMRRNDREQEIIIAVDRQRVRRTAQLN